MGQVYTLHEDKESQKAGIRMVDPSDSTQTGFQDDDEQFIRKVMLDDPKMGVELLFRRYYQPMCSHAVKFIGARETAEDLVSEIFFQFYQDNIFATITSSYRYYLLKTVRNRSYNYLKSQLSHPLSADESCAVETPVGEQPDALIQYEELYHDVQQAINSLPVDRRKVYLMNRFDGKKYQEIATELNLSIKTVEVQLYRANKHIRSLLKDKWYLLVLLFLD